MCVYTCNTNKSSVYFESDVCYGVIVFVVARVYSIVKLVMVVVKLVMPF